MPRRATRRLRRDKPRKPRKSRRASKRPLTRKQPRRPHASKTRRRVHRRRRLRGGQTNETGHNAAHAANVAAAVAPYAPVSLAAGAGLPGSPVYQPYSPAVFQPHSPLGYGYQPVSPGGYPPAPPGGVFDEYAGMHPDELEGVLFELEDRLETLEGRRDTAPATLAALMDDPGTAVTMQDMINEFAPHERDRIMAHAQAHRVAAAEAARHQRGGGRSDVPLNAAELAAEEAIEDAEREIEELQSQIDELDEQLGRLAGRNNVADVKAEIEDQLNGLKVEIAHAQTRLHQLIHGAV